jgi:CHASE2 domain-containing sensor protein
VRRIWIGLAALLGVCLLVRVVAWLLEPALPTLALLVLLAAVAWRVAGGPRFREPGGKF